MSEPKYAVQHETYPQLTTYDADGNAVVFKDHILESDDAELVRNLIARDDIKLVRGKLPAKSKS